MQNLAQNRRTLDGNLAGRKGLTRSDMIFKETTTLYFEPQIPYHINSKGMPSLWKSSSVGDFKETGLENRNLTSNVMGLTVLEF